MLESYLKENKKKTIIVGGDFNTVLDIELDKKNGPSDTHRLCRKKKLIEMIDEFLIL